jgi:hypothetical protein
MTGSMSNVENPNTTRQLVFPASNGTFDVQAPLAISISMSRRN